MPGHESVRHVPYSAAQMFAIVADIKSYPQFVPYCSGMTILSTNAVDDSHQVIEARMSVKYLMLTESFVSRVELKKNENTVDVTLLSGPFRYLTNNWVFIPDSANADAGTGAGTGCNINFRLHYAFKSTMLAVVAGLAFEKLYANFVDAFERRASQIYA